MADVPRGVDRVVPVALTVDGYPRAFVYSVHCDRTYGEVERERSLAAIRLRVPKDGDAMASPLADDAPLWAEFQVDAPDDAFSGPDESVEAWLEVQGDPAFAARTRQCSPATGNGRSAGKGSRRRAS